MNVVLVQPGFPVSTFFLGDLAPDLDADVDLDGDLNLDAAEGLLRRRPRDPRPGAALALLRPRPGPDRVRRRPAEEGPGRPGESLKGDAGRSGEK